MLARFGNLDAVRAAARAAVVIPCVFAFASNVIGRPQVSLFAAFGSFAMLVLVEFGGVRRVRLLAYVTFGLAGAVLITLGTLCSRNAWIAAAAMAVVGFAILFAGAFGGYLAAGSNGAILIFVLSENVPASNSGIPDRLYGWALAASIGTAASLLIWPSRRRADFRRAAADAVEALRDLIDEPSAQASQAARAAVSAVARRFLGAQHRPTGTTAATAALVALPDELDWLCSLLPTSAEERGVLSDEESEALAAAAAVLDASADRLDGGSADADFARLDRTRNEVVRALLQRLARSVPADGSVETTFRVAGATSAARQIGIYAMEATAGNEPAGSFDVAGAGRLALEHSRPSSVWLQNSVRGAVALTIAVYIAQRSGLQHAFWVVLGTLSVLRSNALGTGRSVVEALAGTAAGIVVGAALVLAIGTHHAVLWAVLPPAIFLGAYAPRAISFAAGQAAFTVVLFVLFNLIQPVGWTVGLVRIEDVAIGFAISLGVGILFWPRGAAPALRSALADAYASGADYVAAAMHQVMHGGGEAEVGRTAETVDSAAHRLDDSFRQYLVERSATRYRVEDVASLVAAALRVRRTGQAIVALNAMMGEAPLSSCGPLLDNEVNVLHTWYLSLAYGLANTRAVPPAHARDDAAHRALVECVVADPSPKRGLGLIWVAEYLETLRQLESHIAVRAAAAGVDMSQVDELRLAAERGLRAVVPAHAVHAAAGGGGGGAEEDAR